MKQPAHIFMLADGPALKPGKIAMVINANVADLRITGIIGDWRNTAEEVYSQLVSLKEKGVTRLTAYINSPGGSAFDGNEMYNVVKAFEGEKEVTVGALCASAATIFALAFPKRKGHANSHAMIHRPITRVEGNEDQLESDLVLLRSLQADFVKVYAAAFNKKPEDIIALWKNDFWFNSQVGLQLGFYTELINDSDTSDPESIAYIAKMGYKNMPASLIQMVAQAEEQINNPNPKPTKTTMDAKELRISLGLPESATDAEVAAKIKSNREAAEAAAAAKTNEAETKAEALAQSGVTSKKYAAAQKPHFKALAIANYDAAKAVIDGMPEAQQLTKGLGGGAGTGAVPEERKDWDWEKYQQKNPKALMAMKDENSEHYNPDLFRSLFKNKYGKDFTGKI